MARPRGSKWQGDFTHNKKRHREDGFDTEAEALAWEATAKANLLVGKPLPIRDNSDKVAASVTLKVAYEKTWARTWASSRSSRTAAHNIQTALDYFGPACPLVDITESRLDDYVVHLKKEGKADGTVNRKLAALSKVLRDAYRRRDLARLPSFERQAESEGRHRQISHDEERLLLQTCRLWGWSDMEDALVFLIDTGVRTGEMFTLKDADANLTGDTITIRATNAKSKKPRGVPMTARVREVLKRRVGTGFPWACFTRDGFRYKWERLKDHLSLRDDDTFVPHACRHTCASRLVQAGVELLVVKEWLGHSSIQVTMRYAHLAPKNLTAARDILDRLNSERSAAG